MNKEKKLYASFWLRLSALLIDTILIVLINKVIKGIFHQGLFTDLVEIAFIWLYFTLLNASNWKGTVGKKFVGIEVVDYQHQQITLLQSNIRFFTTLFSALFPPLYLMILFTKKRQTIHDMFAKTFVLNTASMYEYSKVMGTKKTRPDIQFKLGRAIGTIITLIFIGIGIYLLYPAIALVVIYGYMGMENSKAYEKSFHIKYKEKDYNDSRIDFYKHELEKSSKYLVNADGLVDVFEYDTKVGLSLECIQRYLKDNNESDWINQYSGIRKNARNKYATTEYLIKKTKRNEDLIGKNFYIYEMNLVDDISTELTNSWRDKSKPSLCDQNLSSNELYSSFLTEYLSRYIDDYLYSIKHNYTSTLEKHYKKSLDWLKQIAATSPQSIYQKYSVGTVSLEEISKYNHFQASIATYDVIYNSNNIIIVGDLKRGIELWSMSSQKKFNYVKTLTDKYGISKIHKIGNIIYAVGQEKQNHNQFQPDSYENNFFITFAYDEKTNMITELDRIQLGLYSRVNDWNFFDNNNKVAMASKYDRVHIIDISNPKKLKVIQQSRKERNNNMSIDLSVNETTGKLFELSRYGLNVIDISKSKTFNKKIENNFNSTFKGHQAIVVEETENILYSIHITWENEATLYKYDMKNPLKPKLLLSKVLEINFDGWNGGTFPQNMQIHNEKLYVANKNNIYIFDKKFNLIKKIETENIKNFHILKDKIIYTKGKEGLSFVDLK